MFRRDDKLKKGGTARSRTDIVEEARKLRMEREKRRYTERHVIAVQAVVRGHLARLSFQQQLREDVDRKLQDIATLKQMLQKEFILPSSVILPLVSSVLFVAKLRRSKSTTRIDATDATKFEHVVGLLQSNWILSGDSYPAAFGNMSIATLKHVLAGCFQLGSAQTLEFVEALVGCHSTSTRPPSAHTLTVPYQAMIKILTYDTFAPIDQPWWTMPPRLEFTVFMRHALIAAQAVNVSWWRLVLHLVQHAPSPDDKSTILHALLCNILTVPNMRVPPTWLTQLHQLWPALVTVPLDLSRCPPSPIPGIPCSVFLLANGLEILQTSLRSSTTETLPQDLAWISQLLAVIPEESFSLEPLTWMHISTSHSVPVMYPPAVVAQLRIIHLQMRQWCGECFTVNPEGLRRPLSTVVPAPMFPEAATNEDQYGFGYIAQQGSFSILRRFWKKKTQWTTKLMQNLNLFKSERPPRRPSTAQDSPSHVPDVAPFRNAAFTSLVRLCGLFLWRWKSTDKKNSPEMLSFLSFYRSAHGTSLVTTLWTYFQETHDVDATAQSLLLERAAPCDPTACLLLTFALTYNNLLIVLHDNEMHEQGFPLPLAEVERVVVFFKHVLYRRYWLAPRTQTTHPFGEYAVDAATWLLQSLYNRCSRRPFSNVTSWIVKDLDGDDMLESVLNEDPKGQMLLRQMPYLLPYADRVRLFQALLKLERERHQEMAPPCRITIRRGYVLEDGLTKLNAIRRDLKKRVQVHFINEAGTEEVGIDAGGLFKEFWTELSQMAFDPHYGLFQCSDDHLLFPNPMSSQVHSNDTLLFEFLGSILGKALYENIVVQPKFARFFLSKLLGNHNHIHDLPSLDPELYKNLMFLKGYEGNVADLGLSFTIGQDCFGVHKEVDLLPGGSNVGVTNDNRFRYIHLAANYYLNVQIRHQSAAFLAGLSDVVNVRLLHMFNEPELQVLISGSPSAFDVEVMLQYDDGRNHFECFVPCIGLEVGDDFDGRVLFPGQAHWVAVEGA
ncbi:hypothetical protein, variant [Aphanomyces invadans]|uniref:HECT-type E3 ubiquitin transferase n=1 Tax=Aphanomyces invadans TaxID=157072 RepID=A0A024UNB6_9STRA|nr:hypothetical protein, variant [Aphanomyces invadans]ETW07896.1 hypothetical protein, variant [Aphanomyces invadans]|eukprot:XP_008863989.1 hypothetical protein, variant [Aphanomyces invadans]